MVLRNPQQVMPRDLVLLKFQCKELAKMLCAELHVEITQNKYQANKEAYPSHASDRIDGRRSRHWWLRIGSSHCYLHSSPATEISSLAATDVEALYSA